MTTPSKKPAARPDLPNKLDYRVLADGWVDGQRAKKGDIVSLTEAQARYEPVEAVSAAKAAKPATEVAQK